MKYQTVIGILTYSKFDFLKGCVESLFACPFDLDDSIIVIANNSSDRDFIYNVECLAGNRGIATLNFRRNRGTSAAWNAMTRAYDCERLVIMNDDIVVHPGWKKAMEVSYDVKSDVGVFSFHAKHGKDNWAFANAYPQSCSISFQQVTYPPGSFLMYEREKFEEVGGFDEELWTGLEEVDFAVRLMKRGYRNYQVGDPDWRYFYINHYGGATEYFTKDAAPELREQASRNVEYFSKKHQAQWPLTPEFEQSLRRD